MPKYECLTEEVGEMIPVLDFGQGPIEWFHIHEIIDAPTRNKAKYILAKMYPEHFGPYVSDWPRTSIRLVREE